jgi:hypothetical protein
MKVTLFTACFLLFAFTAFGQMPSPTAPVGVSATAATATPALTATQPAAASPSATVTPTASASPSPSADDEIDNAIEKKIRKHFNFNFDRHNSTDDDDSAWIALPIVFIVFLTIFGTPVMIVAVIMYFSFSRSRAMHKTVRMMVEKGQPVPEALLTPPPVVRQRSDLRRGVTLLMIGLGLMVFFGACNDWEGGAWSLGIIPFLIGAGYLLVWRLDVRREEPSPRV